MDLIIVSARPDYWSGFAAFFQERGIGAHAADHPDQAAGIMRDNPQGDFQLIILDLPYDFDSMRGYATQVLHLRPNLSAGATHSMPDYLFAQAAEGLRLFPLPRNPKESDLEKLLGVCALPGPVLPLDPSRLK